MPRITRASTKKLRQPKASRKKALPPTKTSPKDAPSSLHKTPAQAATATTTAVDSITTTAAVADTAPTTITNNAADDDDDGGTAATILTLLLPTAALFADLSAQLETALAAIAEGTASEADAVEEVLTGFVERVGELDEVHGEVAGLLEEVGRGCGWDLEELAVEREGWEQVVEGVVSCVSGWGEDVSEGGDEEEEWVGEGEEEEGDEEWVGKREGRRKRGRGKDNGKKKRGFGGEDEKVVKKRKTEGSAGKGGKKGNEEEDAIAAQVEGMKEEAPDKVAANEEDLRQQKRDSIDEFEIDWDI